MKSASMKKRSRRLAVNAIAFPKCENQNSAALTRKLGFDPK
ncbi:MULTISPECIES: hypothetical protein [Nostocales]|nr:MULTISPECIES: hypothetical protein [Nostocales]